MSHSNDRKSKTKKNSDINPKKAAASCSEANTGTHPISQKSQARRQQDAIL